MIDEPDEKGIAGITGIARDGKGVAKTLLDDPELKRALDKLTGGIAEAVNRTRTNVGDEAAVKAFEDALVGTVIEGVKKALPKID